MQRVRRANKPQNWWGQNISGDKTLNPDTIDDTMLTSSSRPTTYNVRTNAEETWRSE